MFAIGPIAQHDGCVELQQLRYVVAVAETRSFTRAAERCFVAQSALSHQVAKLERELGVRLFARTSRRVEPTPAGVAFLPAARDCLGAARRAADEAAAAAGQVRGHLTVGVIPTVAAVDLADLLERYRLAHPEVRLTLQSGSSRELTARVAAGELDAAFLGLPAGEEPRGVQVRRLAEDEHVAVLPADHALARTARAALADVAAETFVDFSAGSPGRTQSDLAFAAAGLERDVAFEVSTPELMVELVRRRLAVALLPSAFLGAGHEGVVTVPVADGPRRVEHLVWSAFNPAPAVRALLELMPAEVSGG